MAIDITVDEGTRDATPPESEEVFLCGEGPYEFVFPKVGAMLSKMRRASIEAENDDEKAERYYQLQMDWLERGFGSDAWGELIDRLEDEDDELDDRHFMAAFKALLKASSGRPTTSPKGSSRSRSASKQKAARSRKGSASETSTPENSAA